MYLLISHYTKNRGTTDYICEFLEKQKIPYLYLRHPLTETETHSELLEFNGKEKKLLKKYKKSGNFMLEMLRNMLLSFWISMTQIKYYSTGIGFGGFNVFPILYTRIFGKNIYFWGVDYSTKRFGSSILNKVYFSLETLACIFGNKIISSSDRQKEARIQFHKATEEKSIVIYNGFSDIGFQKDFSQYKEIGFLYIGSITPQHGVLDFIQYFYIEKNINNILYIIGGGELENELIEFIERYHLDEKIKFLGRKTQNEIVEFLNTQETKLFGIAPYNDAKNDHVYYIDSLKIREYLSYNLPFIISDIPQVGEDIKDFGIIYNKFSNISMKELSTIKLDIKQKNEVLSKYTWDNLLNKIFN